MDGLADGFIDGAALSQFGVLVTFEGCEYELRFHDLVNGMRFNVGGFSSDMYVTWYESDVVGLAYGQPFVYRASYASFLERKGISTFSTFDIPKCSAWVSVQLAQYTGRMLYSSDDKLVILDLETMIAERTETEMWEAINTGCVVPEGMMGAVCTHKESFFVDEHGREATGTKFGFWCEEAILSLSDPLDLSKALMAEAQLRVPGGRDFLGRVEFEEQTGWDGHCFVRLVDDVFLIFDLEEEERELHVIRIAVS